MSVPRAPRAQAVAGVEDDEGVGKEVRCEGCGVAFCVCHRQQDQHSCPAPSSHTARERATQERKERAQQILQLHFPGTTSKPRPTLPPQKDVDIKRKLPSTTVDQTVTSSSSSSSSASKLHEPRDVSVEDKEGVKVVKTTTKAEKIHQLRLRKLRSLAEPLERPKGVEKMRYFEWCLCTDHGKVKSWLYTGKWEGEVQRGAIACDTSCGRLLDLLISKTKVKRPTDPLDTSSTWGLMSLVSPLDGERTMKRISLSKSAGGEIEEGTLLILLRGAFPLLEPGDVME
ncbi:hypothetical protein M231_01742 [Tremella mesenterica]|uniref:AN1-type domain-containing protein n=1 Tax=Tremella mesenterica TaxID=5217 RepID=A0A4Q1BSA4_TREME|nr:hypothetical protein M231_01742 [Tremella mesenterica]